MSCSEVKTPSTGVFPVAVESIAVAFLFSPHADQNARIREAFAQALRHVNCVAARSRGRDRNAKLADRQLGDLFHHLASQELGRDELTGGSGSRDELREHQPCNLIRIVTRRYHNRCQVRIRWRGSRLGCRLEGGSWNLRLAQITDDEVDLLQHLGTAGIGDGFAVEIFVCQSNGRG